jgi:hypothetical protein
MLVIGYACLYTAFSLVLTVAVVFDLTHVGDILNVAAAIGPPWAWLPTGSGSPYSQPPCGEFCSR